MPKPLPQNELYTRAEFFQREDRAWQTLRETWAGLSDATLLLSGACGEGWSIKNVMDHIATWQEAAHRVIEDLLIGKWGRLGMSTQRFNEYHFALDQDRPLSETLQGLEANRGKLLGLLTTLTDLQLLNEFGQQQPGWWAKWTTYA